MPAHAALHDIPLRRMDGSLATLRDYAGKVLLVVNVASNCGLTPQYAALQSLYAARHARGFEILAFPANNALDQETGDDAQIMEFCTKAYHVTFPVFSKISVTGVDTHPLYRALIAAQPGATGEGPMRQRLTVDYAIETPPPPAILWSFEKFLIGRDGAVLERFAPDVCADDPRVTKAVRAALG